MRSGVSVTMHPFVWRLRNTTDYAGWSSFVEDCPVSMSFKARTHKGRCISYHMPSGQTHWAMAMGAAGGSAPLFGQLLMVGISASTDLRSASTLLRSTVGNGVRCV